MITKREGAPCKACPPCCKSCTWGELQKGSVEVKRTIIAGEDYGCIRGDFDIVETTNGTIAMKTENGIQPLTEEGRKFLAEVDPELLEKLSN